MTDNSPPISFRVPARKASIYSIVAKAEGFKSRSKWIISTLDKAADAATKDGLSPKE